MSTVRIAGVIKQSIVDGPGLRLVIFTQGCPHACEGCHNPETWDFEGGYDCGVGRIIAELDKNPLLKGITLSGGEPFCRASELLPLVREARDRGKDIVAYTGYSFEELCETAKNDPAVAELMMLTDILIDGRYIIERRDLTLRFRGSANQRIIDLPASLKEGRAIEID